MKRKFKCKTPKCGRYVVYVPEITYGLSGGDQRYVYLKCPLGHRNKYDLNDHTR